MKLLKVFLDRESLTYKCYVNYLARPNFRLPNLPGGILVEFSPEMEYKDQQWRI